VAADKRIITPEHFRVAPEVLGLPLASPTRRAYAMAIDLVLIALLVKAGGAFLGLAAAVLLFRASKANQREGFFRQSTRLTLRVIGAILLFAVSMELWDQVSERVAPNADDDEQASNTVPLTTESGMELNLNIPPRQLPGLASALFSMQKADSTTVRTSVTKILNVGKESGATTLQMYEARPGIIELLGDDVDSSGIRAVDSAILTVAGPKPTAKDSAAIVIQGLERAVNTHLATIESLEDQLEEAKKAHGIRAFISGAADDLGVGFGWSAVFFTAFLALWRGQTPGKKVAGVRVIRLDGKPMGWWLSFERFGGYAASLSVGLLGFVQILWDRNRQGLHDKACETVVVMDSAQALSRS
jgi:uncharacterized RDD family membrane protein YckC